MRQKIEKLRAKAHRLPLSPGVYYMKNSEGRIIYVGKAKALKNRVLSYFTGVENHPKKVAAMVSRVEDFDYIVTQSELDALVLECSEIKHYSPEYNILLKDGKGYPYIKVDKKKPYPAVEATRRRLQDGARYFGPYPGGVKSIIETTLKIFKLPVCGKKFPEDIGKTRPCLNFHIKNCCGVCTGDISPEEYRKTIEGVLLFLEGRDKDAIKALELEMQEASDRLMFERAARLRDGIAAIKRLSQTQKVVAAPGVNRDVVGFAEGNSLASVALLTVRDGRVSGKKDFIFSGEGFENDSIDGFLMQYYSASSDIPPEILLPFEPEDTELISQYLCKVSGRKVTLGVPKRGPRRALLEMASANAREQLRMAETKEEKQSRAVAELSALLGLESPAETIEAVDISNTAGGENVGAIVRFKNGKPDKSGYRRFEIRGFAGQDDCASVKEVITRRLKAYEQAKKGFESLPALFLIDGGKTQTAAAKNALDEMGISVPVFGMVKDDKHKTRGLTSERGEVEISMTSSAFTLTAKIQEEVHRFAVEYHRKKRKAKTLSSRLDGISGLGAEKKKALLKYFKTISAIEAASESELAAAPGIGSKLANTIFEHFHKTKHNDG